MQCSTRTGLNQCNFGKPRGANSLRQRHNATACWGKINFPLRVTSLTFPNALYFGREQLRNVGQNMPVDGRMVHKTYSALFAQVSASIEAYTKGPRARGAASVDLVASCASARGSRYHWPTSTAQRPSARARPLLSTKRTTQRLPQYFCRPS